MWKDWKAKVIWELSLLLIDILILKIMKTGEYTFFLFLLRRCGPSRAMASSFTWFLDHTQRRTTVGRTPLDEWSARRRDLYLTTHNTHNRQTFMPPVGFEPTISAGERPQTYALDHAATGTGICQTYFVIIKADMWSFLTSISTAVGSWPLATDM